MNQNFITKKKCCPQYFMSDFQKKNHNFKKKLIFEIELDTFSISRQAPVRHFQNKRFQTSTSKLNTQRTEHELRAPFTHQLCFLTNSNFQKDCEALFRAFDDNITKTFTAYIFSRVSAPPLISIHANSPVKDSLHQIWKLE